MVERPLATPVREGRSLGMIRDVALPSGGAGARREAVPHGAVAAEIAIVGAGPYGLSLAAHLAAAGTPFRIFGRPMAVWRDNMPKGMSLKSEPFATNLYDPHAVRTLQRYCAERGLPYADVGEPVPLALFCEYGLDFQRKCVPALDERLVVGVRRVGAEYAVTLQDGDEERFRRVVFAVGITHFRHVPAELSEMFGSSLAHSSAVGDIERFGGRSLVIGGGASAVDAAVSLARAGGEVHVVTRRAALAFHAPPGPRRLLDRVRAPMSPVGPSWKGVLCTRFPHVFHRMPERFRIEVTRRFLGPAPCWFTREAFERHVNLHGRSTVRSAHPTASGTEIVIETPDGTRTLLVDHVIAATGYRVDLRKLPFLHADLLAEIAHVGHAPILSRCFESSAAGVYFVGVAAANSFGPALRFACGAEFTARRLTRALRIPRRRSSKVDPGPPVSAKRRPLHAGNEAPPRSTASASEV